MSEFANFGLCLAFFAIFMVFGGCDNLTIYCMIMFLPVFVNSNNNNNNNNNMIQKELCLDFVFFPWFSNYYVVSYYSCYCYFLLCLFSCLL